MGSRSLVFQIASYCESEILQNFLSNKENQPDIKKSD